MIEHLKLHYEISMSMLNSAQGALFQPFICMEDLLDKLKLLNYEHEFIHELRMRPLNRHYFVIQTNPGEQFYVFSSLASWLIRKTGKNFEPPQEYDDPNSTIANILEHIRKLGSEIKEHWQIAS